MVQAWILSVATLAVAAAVLIATRERVAALVARLNAEAETDPLTSSSTAGGSPSGSSSSSTAPGATGRRSAW